jgi:uncharacterized membrane protein YgdD (TMEM256/DUF423 family)
MERFFGAIAALAGAAAVIADATAQHAAADPARAALAAIGSRYALVHAAALLALVALLRFGAPGTGRGWLVASCWCFAIALPLFCGTLFLRAAGAGAWLTPLVPVGGTLFIAGWAALAVHFVTPRPPA